jgi:negative regulator of sigma-B (phosphoserine phosphatase)
VPICPGDTLVLATDGVQRAFVDSVRISEPPQELADRILAEFAGATDDALVVAARFRGSAR